MRIEVIGIGDEVLGGYTVNSNAAMISRALLDIGLSVTDHRVLPDQKEGLQRGLKQALEENDLVICSGGLGPTIDDCTRQIVADLLGDHLAFRQEVADRLGDIPTQKNQATIPSTAKVFYNVVGTAPGLLFEDKTTLILLPGVPVELEAMLPEVCTYLEKTYPAALQARATIHFFQVPESVVDQTLRILSSPDLSMGIYPHLGVVTVRLAAKSYERLEEPLARLKKAHPQFFMEGSIQEAVHRRCIEKGLTLATAESCTGGEIAARLTKIPGASDYFMGSVVSYSNEWKERLLGVSSIAEHGAVSSEVAREMAMGTLGCDLAIAVTGIAGPTGGSAEKPVGTVWFAAMRKGENPVITHIRAKGNRQAIIQRSVNHALAEVLKLVS